MSEKEIKEIIFPYTASPFAKLTSQLIFNVRQIKRAVYYDLNSIDRNYFSTDTGLIAFVSEEIFLDFLEVYDYNNLTESINDVVNVGFWNVLTSKFGLNNLALILTPGVNSGYDFEGSGFYQIEQ